MLHHGPVVGFGVTVKTRLQEVSEEIERLLAAWRSMVAPTAADQLRLEERLKALNVDPDAMDRLLPVTPRETLQQPSESE